MNSEEKIRKQFQSKFNDFMVPPPADGWTRLEESLNKTTVARKMINRRRWQYAGSAAAVLVLLVGGLFYLNKTMLEESPLMTDSKTSNIEIEATVEAEPQIEQKVTEAPLLAERNATKSISLLPTDKTILTSNNIEHESQQEVEDLFEINHELIAKENYNVSEVAEESDVFNIIEESIIFEEDETLLYSDYDVKNNEGGYVLSFGGKGGLTSFHQTVNSPMTLRSAVVSSEAPLLGEPDKNLFKTNNSRDNIAEMEHDQPVSFGLTVSKAITSNLYIETGLIYSYLHSRSKNTGSVTQNHQTQSLHYLGVPLNLNYNIFYIRDLNVYVSLGGMIEKDIYGKFREEGESQSLESQNNSEVLINETIYQKNPQLSINTGLGLSYPIYRDLKLYGKIGGAYYFDAKNKYKTIYSDRKIVMDLSLGIRYEF